MVLNKPGTLILSVESTTQTECEEQTEVGLEKKNSFSGGSKKVIMIWAAGSRVEVGSRINLW